MAKTRWDRNLRHAATKEAGGAADRRNAADPRETADPRNPADPRGRRPDPEGTIMELAGRQHGLVTRSQLMEAGIPGHVIAYRMKTGRLRSVHRGVYRVGPLRSSWEREAAAVLACGRGALLSAASAAALWQVGPQEAGDAPPEVSVEGGQRTGVAGVRVHRVSRVVPDERTVLQGIPITTVARTILDLAARSSDAELERLVARAERLGLVDRAQLERMIVRHARARGVRKLRAVLSRDGGPVLTRSEAEAVLLALVRKVGLRMPQGNVKVCGFEVDFLWRAEKLVVEVDGAAFHSSRRAFESDRRRDGVLVAAGFRVIRATWRQLVEEPEAVIVRIAQALVTKP